LQHLNRPLIISRPLAQGFSSGLAEALSAAPRGQGTKKSRQRPFLLTPGMSSDRPGQSYQPHIMDSFYSTLFSFPTGIMTILLAAVLLYWGLVILGALDIDVFDFDVDAPEGAEASGGGMGLFPVLGLTGVPVTVAISLLVLWGWLFTALGSQVLDTLVADGTVRTLLATLVLLLSVVVAVGVSAVSIRPLQRFFDTPEARRRSSLVGQVCTVTTLRVDEAFGQAEFDDGGAGLLVQIRAKEGNGLTKGAKALIISRDERISAYWVRPYDDPAEALLAGNR